MSDGRRITAGAAVVCGLAVISGTSPEADAVVTVIVLVLLGAGAVACLLGYAVHLRRIRRDIAAGEGMRMRREHPEPVPPPPVRGPVCGNAQRARRVPARCRPGRTRYR